MTDMGRRPGPGDMQKSVYDTNKNDIVDNAEKLEGSTKTEVQDHSPATHAHPQAHIQDLVPDLAGKSAVGHGHVEADISDLDHNAQKIKGVTIDDTDKADKKALAYDAASEKIIYTDCFPGFIADFIQHISCTIPADELSLQVTIDEVDLDSTFLLYNNCQANANNANQVGVRLQLIDSTHIEATRNTLTPLIPLNLCVVKTASGIKSIQRGTITLTNEVQKSITISQVALNKTFVNHLGTQTTSTGTAYWLTRLYLTDVITLTASTHLGASVNIVSYEVVEFE